MAEWFRSYHGAPTDPKWIVIGRKAGVEPGKVAATWWALLDHASQQSPRGTVQGFDIEAMAEFWCWPENELRAIYEVFHSRRLIVDGKLRNWPKRQPKREDHSTDRVRRFRDTLKRDETKRNAVETRNTLEREREREKETERPGARAPANQPATTNTAQNETAVAAALPTAATAVATVEAQASEIIRAANHGMVANDSIDADRFRPIEGSHGSRSCVLEWLQAGIPYDLIRSTVAARAAAYQPSDTRKQITTMKYFDPAVRDEWNRRQALPPSGSQAASIRDEYPGNNRTGSRAGPVRFDGYDPEKEQEERHRKEAAAIAEWCQRHPDDAADIRQQIEADVSSDNRWKGLPLGTVQRVVEGMYRDRVHQRIEAA